MEWVCLLILVGTVLFAWHTWSNKRKSIRADRDALRSAGISEHDVELARTDTASLRHGPDPLKRAKRIEKSFAKRVVGAPS